MTFSELRDKLFGNYEAGEITDEQLVQLIELASGYLQRPKYGRTACANVSINKYLFSRVAYIYVLSVVISFLFKLLIQK